MIPLNNVWCMGKSQYIYHIKDDVCICLENNVGKPATLESASKTTSGSRRHLNLPPKRRREAGDVRICLQNDVGKPATFVSAFFAIKCTSLCLVFNFIPFDRRIIDKQLSVYFEFIEIAFYPCCNIHIFCVLYMKMQMRFR